MSTKQVFLSSLKMATATFLSRILGLVREQIMAAYFGASGLTDAFLVAYRIPNLLRDLLAEGAFSSAFVPTFVEANHESKEKGRELLWQLWIILGMITGSISLGIYIFAPELIAVFAPSFKADPEKFQLTISMTRILAPFLFFVSMAALFMGALNSLKVFFMPALAPAWFNVINILGVVFLSGWFVSHGYSAIFSLGWSAMIGGVVQALVQLPSLINRGYGPIRLTKIWSERAIHVLALLGPGLLGFAAAQINLLINTILATSAAVGATSWLNYSFRLFQLPVGILSVSIGNSNLVHFSEAWKKDRKEEALSFLSGSYYLSWITVLPCMAILWSLSDEFVHMIFERGRFTHESSQMTALALRMYVIGLPLYSLNKIWVPVFYTLKKQRIPVMSSIASIVVNIAFSYTMVDTYGFAMLALATSLSMFINCLILGTNLKKELSVSINYFLSLRLLKIIISSLLCAISLEKLSGIFFFYSDPFMTKALVLTVICSVCFAGYLGALVAMGEREIALKIFEKAKRKFKRP